jgi:hypothetical protein
MTIFALTAAEVEARLGEALREFGGVRDLKAERTDFAAANRGRRLARIVQ